MLIFQKIQTQSMIQKKGRILDSEILRKQKIHSIGKNLVFKFYYQKPFQQKTKNDLQKCCNYYESFSELVTRNGYIPKKRVTKSDYSFKIRVSRNGSQFIDPCMRSTGRCWRRSGRPHPRDCRSAWSGPSVRS